jgi:hypothetical protein
MFHTEIRCGNLSAQAEFVTAQAMTRASPGPATRPAKLFTGNITV